MRSRLRRASGHAAFIALGWVLLLGALYWFFAAWSEREANPNRTIVVSADGDMVLQRARNGHYYADGEINGRRVRMLLDTGATQIALSQKLALELGLALGPAITLQTAAGPATGYPTRLDRVRLGPIEMRNLGAVVSEKMGDDAVLLGMNFLKHMALVQQGDQLTIKPPQRAGAP